MGLNQNTWKLNQWYDQDVAGNVSYSGAGEIWASGLNSDYLFLDAIPDGSKRSSPVQLPGTDWVQGRGGGSERPFVAMKKDGSVWSWGKNYLGGLGLNQSTPTTQSSAQEVISAPSTGVQGRIHSDSDSTMFSNEDGELWIWGSNAYGKLGLNEGGAPATANAKSSPCQIPGTTWSKNISGSYSKLGVKTDGTLWTWGRNNQGQLGVNDKNDRSSPIQVGTESTWSTTRGTIASGAGASLSGGIKTDGTLWVWGFNDQGQLGLNNTTSYSSPKQVPGTTWQYISFTDTSGFAQKTDGTIWSWGSNTIGELGHNNRTAYSSPKQVGADTDWAYVRAGLSQKAWGLKTDNTLWVWGQNIAGQMGVNDQVRYSSPVQIPGTDWRSSYDGIFLDGYQSYFLKEL